MAKKKIVLLGGGVGSMTAAYFLTNTQELRDAYDLTVYQMGWRLGGKGASGREMAPRFGHRIYEHGLHIWMGFYYNAFKMIRAVYDELGRPEGAPLRKWDDAFKPHDLITMTEHIGEEWLPWAVSYPVLTGENAIPGEGSEFPDIWGYVQLTIEWIERIFHGYMTQHAAAPAEAKPKWFQAIEQGTADVVDDVVEAAINEALRIAKEHPVSPTLAASNDHHKVADLLDQFLKALWKLIEKEAFTHTDTRRMWILLDMGVAIVKGIVEDGVLTNGWESIDDQEWRKWQISHGLSDISQWGAPMRAVYDLVFGYENGIADADHANLAAGSTTRGVLRMLMGYKGSIFFEMQAGMGDTIFAPMYEVLKRRGVKFEYFHRVRDILPDASGTKVETIVIGQQATLKDEAGGYDPLVVVNDLPCWPATPLYDQLTEGETLRSGEVDLESYWADWKDVATKTLVHGTDFDYVVCGLSLGAIPVVASKLVAANAKWQEMVAKVGTVQTQAFQLWLTPTIDQLGWKAPESAVLGAYVEPMDTWADMSHLLPREDWPKDIQPGNIAYFCGVLPDFPGSHPFDQHDFPEVAWNAARQTALDFCNNDIKTLWPNATTPANPNGLNWELLVDPNAGSGLQRFDAQFFRANIDPSELYVLSLKGSTAARVPGDATGFANLTIAGDWNHNGLNVGCVEAAVMGGMLAARPLIPGGLPIVGEED